MCSFSAGVSECTYDLAYDEDDTPVISQKPSHSFLPAFQELTFDENRVQGPPPLIPPNSSLGNFPSNIHQEQDCSLPCHRWLYEVNTGKAPPPLKSSTLRPHPNSDQRYAASPAAYPENLVSHKLYSPWVVRNGIYRRCNRALTPNFMRRDAKAVSGGQKPAPTSFSSGMDSWEVESATPPPVPRSTKEKLRRMLWEWDDKSRPVPVRPASASPSAMRLPPSSQKYPIPRRPVTAVPRTRPALSTAALSYTAEGKGPQAAAAKAMLASRRANRRMPWLTNPVPAKVESRRPEVKPKKRAVCAVVSQEKSNATIGTVRTGATEEEGGSESGDDDREKGSEGSGSEGDEKTPVHATVSRERVDKIVKSRVELFYHRPSHPSGAYELARGLRSLPLSSQHEVQQRAFPGSPSRVTRIETSPNWGRASRRAVLREQQLLEGTNSEIEDGSASAHPVDLIEMYSECSGSESRAELTLDKDGGLVENMESSLDHWEKPPVCKIDSGEHSSESLSGRRSRTRTPTFLTNRPASACASVRSDCTTSRSLTPSARSHNLPSPHMYGKEPLSTRDYPRARERESSVSPQRLASSLPPSASPPQTPPQSVPPSKSHSRPQSHSRSQSPTSSGPTYSGRPQSASPTSRAPVCGKPGFATHPKEKGREEDEGKKGPGGAIRNGGVEKGKGNRSSSPQRSCRDVSPSRRAESPPWQRKKKRKKPKAKKEQATLKGKARLVKFIREKIIAKRDVTLMLQQWKLSYMSGDVMVTFHGEQMRKRDFDKILVFSDASDEQLKYFASVYKQYCDSYGDRISYNAFCHVVSSHVANPISERIVERLFNFYEPAAPPSSPTGGGCTFLNFCVVMARMAEPKLKPRLDFLFDIIDEDGSGDVSIAEFVWLLRDRCSDVLTMASIINALMIVLDEDESGEVSREEYEDAQNEVPIILIILADALPVIKGVEYEVSETGFSMSNLTELLEFINGMHEVDLNTFIAVVATFFGINDRSLARFLFRLFDKDGDGDVTIREFLAALSRLGQTDERTFNLEVIDRMLNRLGGKHVVTAVELDHLLASLNDMNNAEERQKVVEAISNGKPEFRKRQFLDYVVSHGYLMFRSQETAPKIEYL